MKKSITDSHVHYSNERGRVPVLPVAEVTLECKKILIETLDGFLLQDIVNAPASVQHPDLYMLFFVLLRGAVGLFCSIACIDDKRQLNYTLPVREGSILFENGLVKQ